MKREGGCIHVAIVAIPAAIVAELGSTPPEPACGTEGISTGRLARQEQHPAV